jgi:monoamine oxidase
LEFWATGMAGKGQNTCLTAFVMGDRARALSDMHQRDPKSVEEVALNELSVVWGAALVRQKFVRAVVCDWTTDPWVRGAYSFPAIGCGGRAGRLALQAPWYDGRLVLAGEALSANHPATVSGALESASVAAGLIADTSAGR